jgi:predicted nucleic acid-binding protein
MASRVILVDTSLLADHFRTVDPVVSKLLEEGDVVCHPFVIGEIMMGDPRSRQAIADLLHDLPQLQVASDKEVLEVVERHRLFGTGLGYIDAHLLVAVRLAPPVAIWTRDKRLARAAEQLSIFAEGLPKVQ